MKTPNVSEGEWSQNGHCVIAGGDCERLVADCGDVEMSKDPEIEMADAKFLAASKKMADALCNAMIVIGALKGTSTVAAQCEEQCRQALLEAGYTED